MGEWLLTPVAIFIADWCVRLGTACAVLLRRRREPSVSLAWLAVVLSLPVLGAVAYLMLGETRLGRRRLIRYREIVKQIESPEVRAPHSAESRHHGLRGGDEQLALLAESVGGCVPLGGNDLKLFGDTDKTIDALVADIDAARQHCHLLFYIYLDDSTGERVAEALSRAAQRGVACRLLVDAVGSRSFLSSALRKRLHAAGVQVAAALPANLLRMLLARLDLRNHRKLAIIDGHIGWTGSQNIANADFAPKRRFAPWVDCMVRIDGPIVHDLQTLFVEDWYLDTDQSLAECLRTPPAATTHNVVSQFIGTGPGQSRVAMRLLVQAMIQSAREEIVLTTPYFVPDETTLLSLCATARRGVHVRLVVPKRNDSRMVGLASRGLYEPMLESGVEILEYRDGLLHAKTITVDRRVALISSANLDRRSFELNFETGLVVYDDDFASVLRFLQDGYLEASDRVETRAWSRRPWHRRLVQAAAGLMAPLL